MINLYCFLNKLIINKRYYIILIMIDTLVIAGGGLKGFAMVSSIKQLLNFKIIKLKNIKNYYGTSVGSIISTLLAIGYSIDELLTFIDKFNFEKLSDDIDIDNLFTDFGISTGKNIMTVVQFLFNEKINKNDISFIELYNMKNITLNIIATNITDMIEEVFNHNTNPHMSIMTAIRMSIAVPIIFTPVLFNNKLYLDGGLVNNFPINHVKTDKFIGITTNFKNKSNNDSLMNFIFNFINITIKTINLKNITKFNKDNIIFIENNNIDTAEISLNEGNKNKLLIIGENATINFINKNNYLINKIKFNNYLIDNISFISSAFLLY